jgi:hypothetical protein
MNDDSSSFHHSSMPFYHKSLGCETALTRQHIITSLALKLIRHLVVYRERKLYSNSGCYRLETVILSIHSAWTEAKLVQLLLLTCNWKVLGLNLGLVTNNPDWCFWWFSSVLPVKYSDNTSHCATTTSFQILFNSLFTNHSTTQCYILRAMGCAIK